MRPTDDLQRRLRELLRQRSVAHGDFTLASGRRSSFYIDARRTTMSGAGLALIGALGLERLTARGWAPDLVGGLTLGADPVAYAIAAAAHARGRPIDAFTVRKEAKAHGTGQRIEGCSVAGEGAGVARLRPRLAVPGGAPVIAVGSAASHRLAAQIVGAGAADYFALPEDRDGLRDALTAAVQRCRARLGRAALAQLEAQA